MKLRAPSIEAPPQPAPLSTISQIEAALSQVDHERGAALAELAQLPGREQELLEADASDEQLAEIDVRKRNLERALARAEVRERQLLDRASAIQLANRRDVWASLVPKYREAAAALLRTHHETVRLHGVLAELTRQAAVAGIGSGLPQLPPVYRVFEQFAAAVARIGDNPPVPPAPPPSTTVRFLRSYGAYVTHDCCGFPPAQAQRLVEAGIAEAVPARRPALTELG